jgi:hypothetical protein
VSLKKSSGAVRNVNVGLGQTQFQVVASACQDGLRILQTDPPRTILGGAIVFAVARDLSTLVLVTVLINE